MQNRRPIDQKIKTIIRHRKFLAMSEERLQEMVEEEFGNKPILSIEREDLPGGGLVAKVTYIP